MEVKTPLKRCPDYDGFGNEAFIIEPCHTINDVLRFCADDLGWDGLKVLVDRLSDVSE